jgi:flagellar biosynthesis GTPase FlhF
MRFSIAITFGIFLLFISQVHAFGVERTASDEFEIKKEYNRSRVDDFYRRFVEMDRKDAERRQGEQAMRDQRKVKAKAYEEARREYVKNRKAKPKVSSQAWEAEIKERQRIQEQKRKDYVQRRKDLERMMKSLGRIPEEDEYDLNLQPETGE